jgi:hypothetical protein
LTGGGSFLLLKLDILVLPEFLRVRDLNPTLYGMLGSLVVFILFSILFPERQGADLYEQR